MVSRRVFRDFTVVVVAAGLTLNRLKELLEPMGFGKIRLTDQDTQAPFLIRQVQPQLVVSARNLTVFSGVQLLVAARQEESTKEVPFLVIGDKDDFRPGGLAAKVKVEDLAVMVAAPLTQENLSQAIVELLDPLVDRKREEAYGHKDQAEAKAKAEDWAGAAEFFQASLNKYDGDVDCWLGLAQAQAKLGRFDDAERSYFKALEIDSSSLKAFMGLAEVYEARQEDQLAVDVLRQAMAIARSMEATGQGRSRLSFYIGEFELRLARLVEADEAFGEAIQADPDNPELSTAIGDAYASHGYYAESEKHYQAALSMTQDMAHVFNRLGIAYRRQKKYDKALDLYQRARIRHPEDENLLFNMARTHYETDNLEAAATLLRQALDLAPGFEEAKKFLAWLERKTGRGEAKASVGLEGEP
jgi:tetratricopeptide (TPR) repeat protein